MAKGVKVPCVHCRREFHTTPGEIRKGRKACSKECGSKSRYVVSDTPRVLRIRANGLINSRLKRGAIQKPDRCQQCQKIGKVDGHHSDYTKPDQVEWLCRKCHLARHRDLKRSA